MLISKSKVGVWMSTYHGDDNLSISMEIEVKKYHPP